MTPSPKSLIHVIRRQSALCLRYDEEGRLKTQIYTRYYKYGSGSISYFSFDQNFSYNEIDGTLSGCVIDGDGYSRAINYSYDDFGRLSTVGKSMVTLDGDGVGQNVSYTYVKHSDPDDGTITYNRVDSVTNEYVTLSNGVSSALTAEAFTYTYDASGNITEIKKNGATLFRYAYDSLNQLVREDNTLSGRTYVYEYDRAGNIKSKKTYDYTTATTVSTTLYSTQTYTYGSSRSGDILTALNGSTISYDGALNPLSYVINGSECTLTWTQGRRLASISGEEEGTDYTYTYNDEGIRTGKTVDGVEHIYHLSGTQILSEEWTENGVQHLIVYSYDASGSPISMTYRKSTDAATAAEVYFLVTNLQGDVTYIYDIDGNRVVTYNYDAWGNILSITGTKASTIGRYNPFRYRGYYYDNETGFYYLNSRYYDPSSVRFLNADVYINGNGDLIGFNMFAYCGNNPVMQYDDDGEAPNSIHNAVVEHIVNQYGFKAEIYLDRYGRADLIDYDEGRVYEVKPVSYMLLFGTYKNRIMYNQICRYLIGATVESFVSESNDFRLFKRGTKPVEGQFDYGDYTVYYKLMMPGEIYYLTEPKKDAKSTASVPGMVPSKYKYTQINFQAIALGGALGIGIALIPALNGGGKGVCTQIYY